MFLFALVFMSCQHQTIEYPDHSGALITVIVDWDNSGIAPAKGQGQDKVHSVSLRFFPKDGSEPFQRYLEDNVYNGEIEVPVGEYSVIAMNESVTDAYWHDYYLFHDIDSYDKISASVADNNPASYDYYKPVDGEQFMKEAHKLASWSLDDFSVTADMVTGSRIAKTKAEKDKFTLKADMRRLTSDIRVSVDIVNLASSKLIQGAVRGFAQKMYLASAKSEVSPATQFFTLNERKLNAGSETDGTAWVNFRSFGKQPNGLQAEYSVMLDVILVNGTRYDPATPLDWDFTKDVNQQKDIYINLKITLPKIDEDIDSEDWEDDENIII